ncbi:MAG: SMC-Scp complex subunit ScpB [Elusimicrobiota bacterium]
MENTDLKKAIETLLFITDQPLSTARIAQALGEKNKEKVSGLIAEVQRDYDERQAALQVVEIAEGFQLATRPVYAPYIRGLYKDRMTMRLSRPALETLSIIAYKQPLTRAEIEEIRGVEVIAALETLLEKGLTRVVGRKETVGRPLLYGTTVEFLRHFGLRSLRDLPPIDSYNPAEAVAKLPPMEEEAPQLPLPAEEEQHPPEAEPPEET